MKAETKEKTVLESNKLIAEFMGPSEEWNDSRQGKVRLYVGIHGGRANCEAHELKYHSSWDWLMPVVEKIRDFSVYDNGRLITMSNLHIYITSTGYEWGCSILGSITHCYTERIPHSYKQIELPSIGFKGVDRKSRPIEPVYQSVVQFIKWYNENKES